MKNRTSLYFLILTILTVFINGCGPQQGNDQFVTEISFKDNLKSQMKMTPETIRQLREYGVTDSSELKLEFFFYTNTQDKANQLLNEVAKLDYSVETGLSAGSEKEFLITGWTNKMKMTEEVILNWTKSMCELGYKYDCEFDGWGTNPGQ